MSAPLDFESPFLHARAVRHGRHPQPHRPGSKLENGASIPWREFVKAVYELPPGWDYHGNIPEGISPNQFWSRVYRASQQTTREERKKPRRDAKVGILVRGDTFWVWPEKIPPKEPKPAFIKRRRNWMGELMLQLRTGEPIVLPRRLDTTTVKKLRDRAGQRGWRLQISQGKPNSMTTRVQWVGEIA